MTKTKTYLLTNDHAYGPLSLRVEAGTINEAMGLADRKMEDGASGECNCLGLAADDELPEYVHGWERAYIAQTDREWNVYEPAGAL